MTGLDSVFITQRVRFCNKVLGCFSFYPFLPTDLNNKYKYKDEIGKSGGYCILHSLVCKPPLGKLPFMPYLYKYDKNLILPLKMHGALVATHMTP